VPAAYAVVAGRCDWPLPPAVGLSNNGVIALRALRQFRCVSYVGCDVALDGNPALVSCCRAVGTGPADPAAAGPII